MTIFQCISRLAVRTRPLCLSVSIPTGEVLALWAKFWDFDSLLGAPEWLFLEILYSPMEFFSFLLHKKSSTLRFKLAFWSRSEHCLTRPCREPRRQNDLVKNYNSKLFQFLNRTEWLAEAGIRCMSPWRRRNGWLLLNFSAMFPVLGENCWFQFHTGW